MYDFITSVISKTLRDNIYPKWHQHQARFFLTSYYYAESIFVKKKKSYIVIFSLKGKTTPLPLKTMPTIKYRVADKMLMQINCKFVIAQNPNKKVIKNVGP
jgi:hypothetical protein